VDLRALAAAALAAALAAGCGGDSTAGGAAAADTTVLQAAAPEAQPHTSYIQAGAARPVAPIPNPYAGDAEAIKQGERLFDAMNCSGCHGSDGVGSMCPSLADGRWRYGGTPAAIYQSIYEGRPLGMPRYGHILVDSQLWQLVAYLTSISAPPESVGTANRNDWQGGGKPGKVQGGQ
jgi:mono/diheme cytochrome c family protein